MSTQGRCAWDRSAAVPTPACPSPCHPGPSLPRTPIQGSGISCKVCSQRSRHWQRYGQILSPWAHRRAIPQGRAGWEGGRRSRITSGMTLRGGEVLGRRRLELAAAGRGASRQDGTELTSVLGRSSPYKARTRGPPSAVRRREPLRLQTGRPERVGAARGAESGRGLAAALLLHHLLEHLGRHAPHAALRRRRQDLLQRHVEDQDGVRRDRAALQAVA